MAFLLCSSPESHCSSVLRPSQTLSFFRKQIANPIFFLLGPYLPVSLSTFSIVKIVLCISYQNYSLTAIFSNDRDIMAIKILSMTIIITIWYMASMPCPISSVTLLLQLPSDIARTVPRPQIDQNTVRKVTFSLKKVVRH